MLAPVFRLQIPVHQGQDSLIWYGCCPVAGRKRGAVLTALLPCFSLHAGYLTEASGRGQVS